ncbi:general odorant-binding protein 71 [Agrilus planipennis]|uniref:General odorant-binding protein 71 n=1 Tax=Agrilus planipennis TaxID=224129 RepID=A0A1W4WL66_AGRPL|nr:general odorant-binding protein 71 [Agrilus planipennis]
MNRNESFRIQTPIITIQLPNSNDSIGPDYSSDQDEDQDQTKATDEAEQSQETNASVNHCIIRCLLEQMNVINKTGFPDRQKLAKELLKNVIGRDAEEFFQDSINDCYRQMDGRYLDKCEFSTELILCLINKGKANCNDWPVGIFPYHS